MNVNSSNTDRIMYEKIQTWSLSLGITMIILGMLTSIFAAFTAYFTIILLGIVLVIRGISDIVTIVMPHYGKNPIWHLFGGILALATGVLIILLPGVTAATLTFLLAAFLIVLGLFKIIAAPIEREANWGLMMLSGIISLIFGVWIIQMWPTVSLWLIGLFIGIEIFVQGIVMVTLPFSIPHSRRGGGEQYAH